MLEHFSEVFELQIEFVEMELAHFMQNNNHDPSQVALVINVAPAAVKKNMKLKNKKSKQNNYQALLETNLEPAQLLSQCMAKCQITSMRRGFIAYLKLPHIPGSNIV